MFAQPQRRDHSRAVTRTLTNNHPGAVARVVIGNHSRAVAAAGRG